MKLGVFTVMFGNTALDTVLDYVQKSGLQTVEIGAGNYPGTDHCPIDDLLASKDKAEEWKKKIADRGLEISALSIHGNPLHPDPDFAAKDIEAMRKAFRLAEMLGVKTIAGFSGCPGGGPKDTVPNWVTCAWPPDYADALKWQWEEKVRPFWLEEALMLKNHGLRMGFEMHPGFSVYNTATLLRIREECGENLGANFDPSHLFWQGMDPLVSLKAIGKGVFHVHMKDCRIDGPNMAFKGVLDTMDYGNENERSWIFRTIGYGHGETFWRDFVSTLRVIGYDGALSIEHEDSLMSAAEGFQKAVAFLKNIILTQPRGPITWVK